MKNQIFHIFRKDVRQHRWEILLSLAITAAYAWGEASQSKIQAATAEEPWFLFPWLSMLVVIGWAFLIVRAVHAESLVGDKQFWVTRPYVWWELLSAKLLFVFVCVNIPLLILQAVLLLMAGFPLIPHISGLLWLQLMWALFFIMPVATLGAVTRSVGQLILAALAVLLCSAIVLPEFYELVPAASVPGVNSPLSWLGLVVTLGTGPVAVLWQYARRRTAKSRVLLVGAAASILIMMLATPYGVLIKRAYPPVSNGGQSPVQLAFDPAKPTSHEGGRPEKNKVHIRIPMLVSGISEGQVVDVAASTVKIQGPGGQQWASGWRRSGVLLPSRQRTSEDITIDKEFFDLVKSAPVKVHFAFALAPRQAGETVQMVAQPSEFAVPGEGRCAFSPVRHGEVLCVFPLKDLNFLASVKSDDITCSSEKNGTALPAGTVVYGGTVWGVGRGLPDFGIDPVRVSPLSFWDWGERRERDRPPRICPGTPLTLYADWKDSKRFRTELEIDGLILADYKLDDAPGEGVGFGVSLP